MSINFQKKNTITNAEQLAVITPVKNELPNLRRLLDSMNTQDFPPALWVIVDDQSTDGSSEFLQAETPGLQGVGRTLLVHSNELPPEYGLGIKYSSVVTVGLRALREHERTEGVKYDYIGLLDADCFPDSNYYANLIGKFRALPKLGIASGVLYYETECGLRYDGLPARWARGNIRVWRAACLDQTGYLIAKSADAVTAGMAWVAGWHCQGFEDSRAYGRPMGARTDHTYYGAAAYYFHIPRYYMYSRYLILWLREGPAIARAYRDGYKRAEKDKVRVQVDQCVVKYFRSMLWRYFIEKWITFQNQIRLNRHRRRVSLSQGTHLLGEPRGQTSENVVAAVDTSH